MSRRDSKFVYGDFWLDKRRDGKAPEIWQIATIPEGSRSPVYRSTKCRDLEEAKAVLRAYEAALRSKRTQDPQDAELLPHLFHYIREQGPDVLRLDTVESSFRAWVGFLMQDELGTGATIAEINKVSVDRFRRWRMAPHSWEVEWEGKVYRHTSKGVSGEAVQRNIEDLRAALNHAEAAGRIPMRPRIPSVKKNLRSPSRSHRFTVKQLGAIVAYAAQEPEVQDWLWLMIGTGVRPDAALAFDPAQQWHDDLIDLHPPAWPRTDKRNPVVPAIEPLRERLGRWSALAPVKSRKRWWRTMRTKLGLPQEYVAKTIRHTVASFLRAEGVPGEQISALLGHKDASDTLERTSEGYAHANPRQMGKAIRALTKLWRQVEREAARWSADHLLTITKDGNKIVVAKKPPKR